MAIDDEIQSKHKHSSLPLRILQRTSRTTTNRSSLQSVLSFILSFDLRPRQTLHSSFRISPPAPSPTLRVRMSKVDGALNPILAGKFLFLFAISLCFDWESSFSPFTAFSPQILSFPHGNLSQRHSNFSRLPPCALRGNAFSPLTQWPKMRAPSGEREFRAWKVYNKDMKRVEKQNHGYCDSFGKKDYF